ncbi:Hypothetical_protein [Hexamita inflata]|uniref:Hypothetical_protein n=1 Tax=Hexamita inflata TaxID=28002 RepID=A0AA86Q2Q5_9EUKA|nr:Hypothetical protein HINF_LOCUS33070 [Hexamita inflata]
MNSLKTNEPNIQHDENQTLSAQLINFNLQLQQIQEQNKRQFDLLATQNALQQETLYNEVQALKGLLVDFIHPNSNHDSNIQNNLELSVSELLNPAFKSQIPNNNGLTVFLERIKQDNETINAIELQKSQLQDELCNQSSHIQQLEQSEQNLKTQLESTAKDLTNSVQKMLQNNLNEQKEVNKLKQMVQSGLKEDFNQQQTEQIEQQNETIKQLENRIKYDQVVMKLKEQTSNRLLRQLEIAQQQIDGLNKQINSDKQTHSEQLEEKQYIINQMKLSKGNNNNIAQQLKQYFTYKQQIKQLTGQVGDLEQTNSNNKNEINNLKQQLEQLNKYQINNIKQLNDAKQQITQLTEQNEENKRTYLYTKDDLLMLQEEYDSRLKQISASLIQYKLEILWLEDDHIIVAPLNTNEVQLTYDDDNNIIGVIASPLSDKQNVR